ncbi:hypothetical protein BDW22DRAFT_1358347 [Trametopsis cervina]|nr:hypothetical protein BDW22DRAFT_1358347 [Trametopsis cervina]
MARRSLQFWTMVGAVMTALKLKDAYDDYQELPTEDGQHRTGPIALRTPTDEEAPPLRDDLELDTSIPAIARPKRKRHADCCVCCGLRCGIFWKAFGIVALLFIVWQTIRLIFWASKPVPSGLEHVPEFNTSLQCSDAPHLFNPNQSTYSIPFKLSTASLSIKLLGEAYGTVVITNGAEDATDAQMDLVLRTDDDSLLQFVSFRRPTQEQVDNGSASSEVTLRTPLLEDKSCMRFDIVLHIPPPLKELYLETYSASQIKFSPVTEFTLEKLTLNLYTPSDQNLVLPSATARAKNLAISMTQGYIVGDVTIVDSAVIETNRGNASSNVHIIPASGTSPAVLTTVTGNGRSDFFYMSNPSSDTHRSITSTHKTEGTGDLYLKYEQSAFSGKAEIKAASSTVYGLHTTDFHKHYSSGWVGDEHGRDRLSVHATRQAGWVGLYF